MFVPWMWTLHMLGAIWLSAGVLASLVLFSQMRRTDGDLAGRAFGLRLAWRLMVVFVVPGALLTGGLGFYLLYAFRIGFLPGWVKASVVLFFVLLAGVLVQVAQLRKVLRAVEASRSAGSATPELHQVEQARLPAILHHVNAALIFILISLRAYTPF
jgi:uncharacterized membrane protein